jgi:hypothetical protein
MTPDLDRQAREMRVQHCFEREGGRTSEWWELRSTTDGSYNATCCDPDDADALAEAWNRALTTASDQWRDISSAPKDGSDVLLFFPLHGLNHDHNPQVIICYWRENETYPNVSGWVYQGRASRSYSDVYQPTHWQPLPCAPGSPPPPTDRQSIIAFLANNDDPTHNEYVRELARRIEAGEDLG